MNTVKLKIEPLPSVDSTHILPPCFSTNSLQSNNPSPLLGSPSVPVLLTFESILNKLFNNSKPIPIPLSLTEIIASLSSFAIAEILISPP